MLHWAMKHLTQTGYPNPNIQRAYRNVHKKF